LNEGNQNSIKYSSVMKAKLLIMSAILGLFTARAATPTNSTPLPPIKDVLYKMIEQGKKEAEIEQAFKTNYSYSRFKKTEYKNGRGVVTKTKQKTKTNDPLKAASKLEDPSDKKPYEESDVPKGDELLERFSFTLVGREVLNGRPALVIDFEPAKKKLSERNLKEKFLNKAAGRAWVDEAEYVIVKASVRLAKPVTIVGGLVGTIHKFTFNFLRQRTPEGIWFTQNYDWHLEGREVIVDRIIDFSSETRDVIRTTPVDAKTAPARRIDDPGRQQ